MQTTKRPIYLAVSLDVEEEGLFGGKYQRHSPSVLNVPSLLRLLPLMEQGIRPSLFCAHSVFADKASCHILEKLRDHHGAEIGAHLHHWNTPPLAIIPEEERNIPQSARKVPSNAVSNQLMEMKLDRLFEAGRIFQGAPMTTFRMGRWDIHCHHWQMLADRGILCDASVRPLHAPASRGIGNPPDHFDAPCNPYWIPTRGEKILEVPLTVTPLFQAFPKVVTLFSPRHPIRRMMRSTAQKWAALALLPIYHPLWAMKLVTRIFAARGGQVLSLTWHSSEMFPGGTPHLPDEASVQSLLQKISLYVEWLHDNWEVMPLTMGELRQTLGPQASTPTSDYPNDWTVPAHLNRPAQSQGNVHAHRA